MRLSRKLFWRVAMLDSEEFSAFIVKTHPKLLNFARKHLHRCSAQDAPDVVQAALLQIWRHREEDITNLRQYTYLAILQNCLDRNKRAKRYLETFKSWKAPARNQIYRLSDSFTYAQISQLLNRVPIADRAAWLEAIESGSGRFSMPEGETQYYRNRIARQKVRIRKVFTATA